MSFYRSIVCDGCQAEIGWKGRPTQAEMEQQARDKGWHAPDRLGRHWCLSCRSEAGRVQWWRKENVRRGLPAGYGLGQCTCNKHGPDWKLNLDCMAAGHPGVERRV